MRNFNYVPNILSFFRLLCGPVMFVLLLNNLIIYKWLSLFVFFLGSISDALDGYFARVYNWTTNFGKNIDPLADKVFIISTLLAIYYICPQFFPIWMLFTVIIRDLFVTFIRLISSRNAVPFATSNFAKLKTVVQSVSIHLCILIIILSNYYDISFHIIYYIMLFMTLVTLLTGFDYFKSFLRNLNDK